MSTLPCGRPAPKSPARARDEASVLAELTRKLENFTSSETLRRTGARKKILGAIVQGSRHFTALDLVERLRARNPEVGRATLYRNLPLLVKSGVLKEGPSSPDGETLYELADGRHHDHIVCLDCRRIFEFHDAGIERRQDAVTEGLGFVPAGHRHEIYASCAYRAKRS
jgi:Fur family ferric uptake transcriptional regulator